MIIMSQAGVGLVMTKIRVTSGSNRCPQPFQLIVDLLPGLR